MPDDLTDAKIAGAEARTDAKLAPFQGQFDRMSDKIDDLAVAIRDQRDEAKQQRSEAHVEATGNRNTLVTIVLATGFALAALLIGAMAYGDLVFSRGMSVRDLVKSVVEEQAAKTTKAP